MKKEENHFNKFRSPIPKHLTPEERKRWEEEIAWEAQEKERRRMEGFYPDEESQGIVSKIKKRLNFKRKKSNDCGIGYIS